MVSRCLDCLFLPGSSVGRLGKVTTTFARGVSPEVTSWEVPSLASCALLLSQYFSSKAVSVRSLASLLRRRCQWQCSGEEKARGGSWARGIQLPSNTLQALCMPPSPAKPTVAEGDQDSNCNHSGMPRLLILAGLVDEGTETGVSGIVNEVY